MLLPAISKEVFTWGPGHLVLSVLLQLSCCHDLRYLIQSYPRIIFMSSQHNWTVGGMNLLHFSGYVTILSCELYFIALYIFYWAQ